MMRRYLYPLLILLLCAAILANVLLLVNRVSGSPPAPYDMGPRAGQFFPSFRVYYVEGDELHSVDRLIRTIRQSSVLNALAAYEMVAEETLYEREGKLLQIEVLNVYEGEETIFLRVDPASFQRSHFTLDNFYLYVMSLVNTITEVAPGKRVAFLFEDMIESPTLYGLDMNRVFGRDEGVILHSAEEVYGALLDFLRAVGRQNTNIAYQLITPEDRRYYSYSDFFPFAKAYHEIHLNELPQDYQVSATEDGYRVVVYYDASSASHREEWFLLPFEDKIYVQMDSPPLDGVE